MLSRVEAMKTVLMTAFQFPPMAGTSGVQRTLRFVQHLPSFGWRPIVFTVRRGIYANVDPSTEQEIPADCPVVRSPCLDTARHLAVAGRYPGVLALPDRWASWRWFARFKLNEVLRHGRPNVVWSTYPIATAHHLGCDLAARLQVPWVADFRDPMAQDGYPPDRRQHRAYVETERRAMRHARRLVFVTPSALATYRKRYPEVSEERFELIENGFDEGVFEGLAAADPSPARDRPLVLLHSGVVYPKERNPNALFAALRWLSDAGRLSPRDLILRFRAPAHDAFVREAAQAHGVADFIDIRPQVAYRTALEEMMAADALLVLQANDCNEQIPAKVYEYLRTGRPLLGFTDPAGDTGQLLHSLSLPWLAPLESEQAIAALLPRVVTELRSGRVVVPDSAQVARYSRRRLTQRLAAMLDAVSDA